MRYLITVITFLFVASQLNAQVKLYGKVTDASTGETLIGATIKYGEGLGTVTNIDGEYEISLAQGTYSIAVSFVGYETINKEVKISNEDLEFNFEMSSNIQLLEINVVGDIAKSRETPVAFSTISPKTLQEIISNQDLPMVLNSTPGIYAATEGGGDGDAQVSIRGFSPRNVGVLLDGVPVNDMENGHVYWSNWFGLDAVTRSMQVQRGLGASKLALPSVGGTINILTKGMDNRKETSIKQEIGSNGYVRTTIGLNSGIIGNGWGFSFAGSYKRGNGWVDQTWTKGFFYYAKIDKKLKNHTISLSGYGAPQSHAQRSYQLPIQYYSSEIALELGVPEEDVAAVTPRGLKYNQHWGYLARTLDDSTATPQPFAERVNQYHKPQFTLKDSWVVNDKIFVSNILYASIGNGGGIRSKSTPSEFEETGLMDFQKIYERNTNRWSYQKKYPRYEDLHRSTNYMRRLVNSHRWFGLLSTFNYEINDMHSFAGGVDLRTYRGIHYEEVYDLLGGDYAEFDYKFEGYLENLDKFLIQEGDINNYHNDGFVRWGGVFAQWEYKTPEYSAFVNLTGSGSGYQRVDYMIFRKKSDAKEREGFTYFNDEEGYKAEKTPWKWFSGFTAKGGANYNINNRMNAFFNLGYLNKAPRFNNVFYYDNELFTNIENEKVKSFEFGYSYASPVFSSNINAYYTIWENKPVDGRFTKPDPRDATKDLTVNINGLDALHKGLEIDFIVKPLHNLDFQGVVSLGDWIWNSADTARIYDDNQNYLGFEYVNAKGIHVGNSAQTQLGAEIRWEPIKHFYVKPHVTFFDRYYAEFDPISLDDNDPQESWQIPSYAIYDLHFGYSFIVNNKRVIARANILNLFDKARIIRAQNNSEHNDKIYTDNDAKSASVFFGLGRTVNLSLKLIL